jgi:hypothetical protein
LITDLARQEREKIEFLKEQISSEKLQTTAKTNDEIQEIEEKEKLVKELEDREESKK